MADQDPVPTTGVEDRRPNLTGDLETVLASGPVFRSHLRGYDRLQVDDYVRWAESELAGARREIEDLAGRYGSALAELKLSGELLALSPEGRELQRTSERIGEMLRLAADEAAEMRAAAAERADVLLRDARAEADERLRAVRETEEAATAAAERLREEAAAARSEAETALREARAEASRVLAGSAAQRDAMLAAATAEVTGMKEELADLTRQQNQARQCLDRLSVQVGEALDGLLEGLPPDVRVPARADGSGPRAHAFTGNGAARS